MAAPCETHHTLNEITGWLTEHRRDSSGVIAARKRDRAQRRREKLANSPSHRIANATRARLWAALKGQGDGALFSRLGYTRDDLVSHLESLLTDGMTMANYGLWHVDHKQPCASFDLTDAAQFDECWALSNLQPLWAADNIRKGAS